MAGPAALLPFGGGGSLALGLGDHDCCHEAAVGVGATTTTVAGARALTHHPYAARADMEGWAGRVGNWERMLHRRRTQCSWIAPAQRAETDAFYMLCQQHRDQLRDHSGRLHPLDFFDAAETPFHCPVDLFTTYRRYPATFTKYRHPQSQPLTLGRTLGVPALPARSLVGDFSRHPDTHWKGQSKMMFT